MTKENKKLYPQTQFDVDLETIRKMGISGDLKIEKGKALAFIFLNQDNEMLVDRFTIADYRENILKEE
jgi:hypothetical protein